MKFTFLTLFFLLFSVFVQSQVQINPPFAFPDVNIVQVGDRAYAFGGTDLEPYNFDTATFIMPYWRLFSSDDLIHWRFESFLDPASTYMGASNKCFAGHGVYKNEKWYWYFSNYVKNTGVAVSESPKGPWKDVLGEPLLPTDLSITKEYDGCVFTDDDGRSYMIYGSWKDKKICYHIAELNEDMISLKEQPIKIPVENTPGPGPGYVPPVDAPFMHKANGKYYLSWRKPYAVADNIYGPYVYMKHQDAYGHLGFFSFNNQDFVNYTTLKKEFRRRYRFSSIAYVHYLEDGSIAPMEDIIHENGVGQYNASWPAIEAEWFMKMPDGPEKMVKADSGFVVGNLKSGDYLVYPNIHDCPYNAKVKLSYTSVTEGKVIVKAYAENGPVIGSGEFKSTGSWDNYRELIIQLDKTPPGSLSLCFVFEGAADEELLRLDNFKIEKPKQ